jgi:hypothetical protein
MNKMGTGANVVPREMITPPRASLMGQLRVARPTEKLSELHSYEDTPPEFIMAAHLNGALRFRDLIEQTSDSQEIFL